MVSCNVFPSREKVLTDYVMRFESLARKAKYATGNEETYNMFLQGLPESLLCNTLKPPIPLNYNEAKERVKPLAQGQAVIEGILKRALLEAPHFNTSTINPDGPSSKTTGRATTSREATLRIITPQMHPHL